MITAGTPSEPLSESLLRTRRKLLDLTARNRLLHFGASRGQTLEVVGAGLAPLWNRLLGGQSCGFVAAAPHDHEEAGATPDTPPRPATRVRRGSSEWLQTRLETLQLETLLKRMRQRAATAIDETGVNMLFLAMGRLTWYEAGASAQPRHAPLLLVPVELERLAAGTGGGGGGTLARYRLRGTGEEVQGNASLAMKLEQDFGLALPENDDETDPDSHLSAVRSMLGAASRADGSFGRWGVNDACHLGFFSFRKLLMYADLDPRQWGGEAGLASRTLVASLVHGADAKDDAPQAGLFLDDYDVDRHPEADRLLLVDNADSSQHSALIDIAEGRNLVIEGPPGTGKSQTITNAIGAALGAGKTVLFVAEKLAALEVVKNNLERAGLGHLCLELHSDAAKPAVVYASLKERLNHGAAPLPGVGEAVARVVEDRETINGYLAASSRAVGPRAEPLHTLLWRTSALGARGRLPLMAASGSRDERVPGTNDPGEFERCSTALAVVTRHLDEVGAPALHPWRAVDLAGMKPKDRRALDKTLTSLENSVEAAKAASRSLADLAPLGEKAWRSVVSDLADGSARAALRSAPDPAPEDALAAVLVASGDRDWANAMRDRLQALETGEAWCARRLTCSRDAAAEASAAAIAALSRREEGLPENTTVADVEHLASTLAEAVDRVRGLRADADALVGRGIRSPARLSGFRPALRTLLLVQHPFAADATALDEPLFHRRSLAECKAARLEAGEIKKKHDELAKTLSLRDLPELHEVDELRSTLLPFAHRRFRCFSSVYRSASRRLVGFLLPGAPRDLPGRLALLTTWLELEERRRAFERGESHGGLGAGFRGFQTDWNRLERSASWCSKATEEGIDFTTAQRLLAARDAAAAEAPDPEAMNQRVKAAAQALKDPGLMTMLCGPSAETSGTSTAAPLAERCLAVLMQELADAAEDCACVLRAAGCVGAAGDTPMSDVRSSLRAVSETVEAHASLERLEAALPPGPAAVVAARKPGRFSTEVVDAALAWAGSLDPLRLPTPLLGWIAESGRPVAAAAKLGERVDAMSASLRAWSDARARLEGFGGIATGVLDDPRGDAADPWNTGLLERLRSGERQAGAWADFCRARREARRLGLGRFVEAAAAGTVPPMHLVETYEATVLDRVAQEEIEREPVLRRFSRQRIEETRERFRVRDRELLDVSRRAAASVGTGRTAPRGNSMGRVGEYTEMSLIRHEVQKQRRHARIRDLVQRAPEALVALKPCFMLSPISVAQFLPPGSIEFDLVIMDEASQIRPEDALGTAIRAKQLVVVGDPKQLPPTSFFEKMTGDEDTLGDDQTVIDDNESVLEVAMKVFPHHRRLRWHYRSQHEDLIAFSNERYYENDLVVFPSASRGGGEDAASLGLRFHHVEGGTFRKGENPVEADRVARAIVEHALQRPEESLGVGAFNLKHRDMIEARLDALCDADPAARRAVEALQDREQELPLFIKNLENLQGDERDVIFLAATYGPDAASGKVMQRFGPLGSPTGWRRLNVLVTRARKRVEVYSSLSPAQIVPGAKTHRGVADLRDYLRFARDGEIVEPGTTTGRPADSPFEEAVSRVVREAGFFPVPQVGVAGYFIDLGVKATANSPDYLLGIECDGATYHSAKSSRDRDRLRQQVIESRGWRLHRIWSTDWFQNRDTEVYRLKRAIRAAARRA